MTHEPWQRQHLLTLARQSIHAGLQAGRRVPYSSPSMFPLEERRATFVTLHLNASLRGCCGSVEAQRPLAEDVWCNAWSSAFSDPRFAALTREEFADVELHISILSELEPLAASHPAELLAALRPGMDGLLLRTKTTQATFLPEVWRQLPDPAEFLRHLRLKAGWDTNSWPADLRVYRYTSESFGEI